MAIKADGSLWFVIGDSLPLPSELASLGQVGTDTDWASVSPGMESLAALKTDGSLWTLAGPDSFVQVGPDTDWASVSTGPSGAVALKTDGSLWVWGRRDFGPDTLPTQVGAGRHWASVAAVLDGGLFIAIDADGGLWLGTLAAAGEVWFDLMTGEQVDGSP